MTDRKDRRINRAVGKMQKQYGGTGKPKKIRQQARRYFEQLPLAEQNAEIEKYQKMLRTDNRDVIAQASMIGAERMKP